MFNECNKVLPNSICVGSMEGRIVSPPDVATPLSGFLPLFLTALFVAPSSSTMATRPLVMILHSHYNLSSCHSCFVIDCDLNPPPEDELNIPRKTFCNFRRRVFRFSFNLLYAIIHYINACLRVGFSLCKASSVSAP